MKENPWRQISREIWIREGGKNTQFFFKKKWSMHTVE